MAHPLTRSPALGSLALMGAREVTYPLVSYLPSDSIPPSTSSSIPTHVHPHSSGTTPTNKPLIGADRPSQTPSQTGADRPSQTPSQTGADRPSQTPSQTGADRPSRTGAGLPPVYGSSFPYTPLGHCPAASERVKLALVSLGNQIINHFFVVDLVLCFSCTNGFIPCP